MPATATPSAPTSLSDIFAAANAAPSAPEPVTTPSAPATPPASDSTTTTTTAADDTGAAAAAAADGTATTTDDGTAAAAAAATTTDGAAAAPATPATPAAQIDWGSAMPALVAKAQALGVKPGVIAKFGNNIDELLRSIDARETQVGELSGYAGAFHNLAESGVTIQELQALRSGDLQRLNSLLVARLGPRAAAALQAPQPGTNGNGQPAGAPPAWSKALLAGRDAEGKPIFNRAELAKRNMTEAQAAQALDAWNAQLADNFAGPEAIEEFLGKMIDARLGPATQQTKQELTAAQQAQQQALQEQAAYERAQVAYQTQVSSWANENANLLYTNKKDISGGATPFYQQMEQVMARLGLPPTPSVQQLEEVKNYVLAVNRPPAATPTPSAKATRVPAAGAQAKKLTDTEFITKYGDRFEAGGLAEWVKYLADGTVPEVRRR